MISRSLLEEVLDEWAAQYGHGQGELEIMRDGAGGHGRVTLGTRADEFNHAWLRLAGGSARDWRMAQSLEADKFARPTDPMDLILQRMLSLGIRMDTKEFVTHVEWAKAYFCTCLQFRARAA